MADCIYGLNVFMYIYKTKGLAWTQKISIEYLHLSQINIWHVILLFKRVAVLVCFGDGGKCCQDAANYWQLYKAFKARQTKAICHWLHLRSNPGLYPSLGPIKFHFRDWVARV